MAPRRESRVGALANEAYLKLVRTGGIRCEDRVHFLALCSQIMRRIVADHARSEPRRHKPANLPQRRENRGFL
ncbi:MAG: hypothetical protein JST11_15020 [Acidobacteria bacterium]|nr:hypothetical protein [Acidobacteriota bacterium]